MDRRIAEACVGLLCGCTPGWDTNSVQYTTEQIIRHWQFDRDLPDNDRMPPDADLAYNAVDSICMTWQKGYRPPWAAIHQSWLDTLRRERAMRPPIEGYEDEVVPPAEGRKIAARAYVAECRKQGREPNWPMFDRIIGSIGTDVSRETPTEEGTT